MNLVFFFLDTVVFLAIVVTLVSLATAIGVLLSGFSKPSLTLRFALAFLVFLLSLIFSSVLAYDVVIASIPAGRWVNLLLLTLIAPVIMPIIWSAMKYTGRNLRSE